MKYLLLLFLPLFALAQEQDFCHIEGQKVLKSVKAPRKTDYFFKVSHDGKYIYYISSGANYRLEIETGRELRIDGSYDPVPSPDGKVLSYLDGNMVYHLTPIDDNGNIVTPADFSNGFKRTYQSVGNLASNSYRLFSQELRESESPDTKWSYQDFKLVAGRPVLTSEVKQIPGTAKLRLGMMSRNGKEFVALNTATGRTEIRSVDGTVMNVLPVGGGKGDFSFDNSKVAFHLTVTESAEERGTELELGGIQHQAKSSRNIFVYDRKKKQLKQVTNFTKGNALFPVFLEDGRIAYLYAENGNFEFQFVNEPKASLRTKAAVKDCLGADAGENALVKFAENWLDRCQSWKGKANLEMAKLAVLGLPEEHCRALGKASKLDQKTIDGVCAPKSAPKPTNPVKKEEPKVSAPGKTLLMNKCSICHFDVPFGDPAKLGPWKKKIEERISHPDPAKRMPRGGSLSAGEQAQIKQYLNQFVK